MKRFIAAVTAAAMCLVFTSCSSSSALTGQSGTTGFNAMLSGSTVTGKGYTLNFDHSKWISPDEYMTLLSDMGYDFEESKADELTQNADGVLYFVDDSIKENIRQEYFAYDVPHVSISAPDKSQGYEGITIEDIGEQCLDGLENLYKDMDGIELLRDESQFTDIDGRTFLKVVIRYKYPHEEDHEIPMKRELYQIIENSVMYTLTFSAPYDLSDELEEEFVKLVKTLTFL